MSDTKFFDNAREMFSTQGWKDFIENVNQSIISARIENLKEAKDFYKAQGELAVLHQIAGYQSSIEAAEQQATEDDDEVFE